MLTVHHLNVVLCHHHSSSFIMIAKTAIEFDIMSRGKNLGFRDSFVHMIKVLPCYATIIVFRVSALSLTIAFLRLWSLIPICFLFVEQALISYSRYRDVQNTFRKYEDTYFLFLSNVGVLNAYSIGRIGENEEPDNENSSIL